MVAPWIAQLARGVLALALGVTVALTLDHSPLFGLLTFGGFTVLSGVVLLIASLRSDYAAPRRGLFAAQAGVAIVAGGVALAVPTGGVAFFGFLVGAWALAAGLLELAAGILSRGRSPLARDWTLVGALTVVLGAVALLLPPDFVQAFAGDRGVSGTLTTSVILVGVVGAWAVLVGVLQAISAVSVRGVRTPSAVTS